MSQMNVSLPLLNNNLRPVDVKFIQPDKKQSSGIFMRIPKFQDIKESKLQVDDSKKLALALNKRIKH